MKTQTTTLAKALLNKVKANIAKNASVNLLGVLVLLSVTASCFGQANAKRPLKFGMGAGAHVSGDGLGAFYSVYAQLYNGKNQLSGGICIQKRNPQLNGGRITFTHILTGRDYKTFTAMADYNVEDAPRYEEFNRLQLTTFGYAQYVHNASLSYSTAKEEEITKRNADLNTQNSSKARLSAIEGAAGIGLNVKITKNLVWGNYAALGAYYYTNYQKGMYKSRAGAMLTIGTTLSFSSFR